MPGLARSAPQDLEIFSGHIAKARHQAGNYSYNYSLHLRRISFAASYRLFRRQGLGIEPVLRWRLSRGRTGREEKEGGLKCGYRPMLA
jgi:hypothetical protein